MPSRNFVWLDSYTPLGISIDILFELCDCLVSSESSWFLKCLFHVLWSFTTRHGRRFELIACKTSFKVDKCAPQRPLFIFVLVVLCITFNDLLVMSPIVFGIAQACSSIFVIKLGDLPGGERSDIH